MKPKIFHIIIIISFIVFSVVIISQTSHLKLKIGDKINDKNELEQDEEYTLTSSSSTARLYKLNSNGVPFHIGLNDNDEINFISTNDKGFITTDGVKIGSTLGEIKQITTNKLICEHGFGCYVLLNSGWYAGFYGDRLFYIAEPTDTSKTVWFFKR